MNGARPLGRVARLWRYPVKSMRGESLQALELDARGVRGDRQYAVRTPQGKFGSGKNTRRFARIEGLLDLEAAGEAPVIGFPDGARRRGDDPKIDAHLSNALGTAVSLRREGDVSHFDAAPVHLFTTASLAALGDQTPEGSIDERRFRPNLVIDSESSETSWIGRRIRIGERVVVQVLDHTERCVMVTMRQGGLPAQASLLHALTRRDEALFGVYAGVISPGHLQVGDPLSFAN